MRRGEDERDAGATEDGFPATDRRWMARCLELARAAGAAGEVPVGAVVVAADGTTELGAGANRCKADVDPLAHAEMLALRAAFARAGDARLPGVTLYCSLEPCFMCAGAALHARVARIVYATRDPKFGACRSLARLPEDRRLNHRCEVHEGLEQEASAALLQGFFQRLRAARRGGDGAPSGPPEGGDAADRDPGRGDL